MIIPPSPASGRLCRALLGPLVLALLCLGLGIPARAATLTVTNTGDSGVGSLRQAIASAGPGDTINFNPAAFATRQTITLTSGELRITRDLTLQGPPAGVAVDGNHASRVFHITAGTVAMSHLTIQNGGNNGGGVAFGGGIFNSGTLTLTACTLAGNAAQGANGSNGAAYGGGGGGGGAGLGGGIFSDSGASLTLVDCTLAGNSATGGAGGAGARDADPPGNGVFSGPPGPGGAGGGPSAGAGGAAVGGAGGTGGFGSGGGGGGSYVSQIQALNNGGGGGFGGGGGGGGAVGINLIGAGNFTEPPSPGGLGGGYAVAGVGAVTENQINHMVVGGNQDSGGAGGGGGAGMGGAVFNNGGTLTLTNCTLSANVAQGGPAGPGGSVVEYFVTGNGTIPTASHVTEGADGIALGGGVFNNTGQASLTSTTVADSKEIDADGIILALPNSAQSDGGVYNLSGSVTLRDALLADTTVTSAPVGRTPSDYAQSGGGMVTAYGSFFSLQDTPNGNSTGVSNGVNQNEIYTVGPPLDPKLGPLQDNGGPTQTRALLPGSPCISAGTSAGAPAADQRGIPRSPGQVDIGAFQVARLARDDAYAATAGTPLVVAAPGVLANDRDEISTALTAVLGTGPAHAASFTLNPDGSFAYTPAAGFSGQDSFQYSFQDAGDATSNPATVTITVKDTSPPVTTAALSPSAPSGLNGWYTGPVTVTLSATDPDGVADVAATVYALDGAATQPYGGPISVTGDAVHTFTFHSVDVAGNAEAPQVLTVKIDGSPPVTAGAPVITPATGTAGSSALVTLTAADALSGVAGTVYALDGGAQRTYVSGTPVAITGAGRHTFTFHSTDVAGNAEAPRTLSVTLTARLLHTFPAGLQMIAVPEDFSAVPLAQAWSAPAGQALTGWGASYVTSPALPALGRGAWVRLAQPTDLFDAGTPAPTAAPFPVPLAAGWNLVGSPFPATVGGAGLVVKDALGGPHTLAQANRLGLVSSTTYGYPAGATGYQAQGPGGSLQPYEGYWVYAFHPCTLLIPPPAAAAAARR